MIGTGETGVAAMVGKGQQQIVFPEAAGEAPQGEVKGRQRRCVTVYITAVAVAAVKINQVDKAKPTKRFVRQRQRFRHAVGV